MLTAIYILGCFVGIMRAAVIAGTYPERSCYTYDDHRAEAFWFWNISGSIAWPVIIFPYVAHRIAKHRRLRSEQRQNELAEAERTIAEHHQLRR